MESSKIDPWCELFCAVCACSGLCGYLQSRLTKKNLVNTAKQHTGWLFKHDESFCGQSCLEEFEATSVAKEQ